MRRPNLLLPIAFALVPALATATPQRLANDELLRSELLLRLVEREREPVNLPKEVFLDDRSRSLPRPPAVASVASALDCIHATHDITLDPATGVTKASLELRVRATGGPLASINISMDKGLEVDEVSVSDRSVSVADALFGPSRVVRVTLDPALEAGEETVITIPYSGTLSCAPAESGARACSKSSEFSYFAHQSIFPFIFDPESPESFVFDGLTREIVLHVPAELDVVVTGQKIAETVDGTTKSATWSIDKPLSRIVGMYALVGKLGRKAVQGRAVPTTLIFPAPEKTVDQDLVSWSTPALDFVERASGRTLPFDRGLSLVRLPKAIGDPGTATFGMTLLSDSYSRMGNLLYEETWAHENAHLFWGIVVPETNSKESRLMSEGMATLTELEYTFARHFAEEDRELYLARRFLPIGLDIRAHGRTVPPIQVAPDAELTEDFRGPRYMLWAYYKTAATLDHLRVTIGEDVFSDVLSSYLTRCSFVSCTPDALRDIASEKSGKDMSPFFDRWVTASEVPRVDVGFTPVSGGVDVVLTKDDERPMTLELWLGLEDGSRSKQRVDLGGRTSRVHIDTPVRALSVSASPRHDLLVDVRSAVEGDLDFDGETDGFDVLRCARLVGSAYESKGATGLWNIGETFDPRCDVDRNFKIDDADLALVTAQFGKLRAR